LAPPNYQSDSKLRAVPKRLCPPDCQRAKIAPLAHLMVLKFIKPMPLADLAPMTYEYLIRSLIEIIIITALSCIHR